MRINEAFGDTVNWDLIPTTAIRSVTVVTNNPAFGLNALGGAVNVQMKDGFNYQGAEINTWAARSGASRARRNRASRSTILCRLWRARRPARQRLSQFFGSRTIRRFYGDVGYRNDSSEFHLNYGRCQQQFRRVGDCRRSNCCSNIGARPIRRRRPPTTRSAYVNLTGKVEVTPTWTIDGSVRICASSTEDRRTEIPTDDQPCAADPALLCFNDDAAPANGVNGVQLANPFPADAILGQIDRTTHPFDDDGRDAAGNQHRPAVRPQQPVHGRHQFRFQRHPLRRQRRTGHDRLELRRQRQRHIPRAASGESRFRSVRSRFAPPTSTPGSMRSTRST